MLHLDYDREMAFVAVSHELGQEENSPMTSLQKKSWVPSGSGLIRIICK